MKKLKKLKLHEFTAMDEREMKQVVGGNSYSYASSSCSSGEKLFTCETCLDPKDYNTMQGAYGVGLGNSCSQGFVCAPYQGEAMARIARNFGKQGIGEYRIRCSEA